MQVAGTKLHSKCDFEVWRQPGFRGTRCATAVPAVSATGNRRRV